MRHTIGTATAVAVGWTLMVAVSLVWGLHGSREQSLEIARHEAAAYIAKDIVFRNWASSHGGVYVPPTEATPPNPYLAHVPNRDVETTSGKFLTLMNPAYMLREMQTHFSGPFKERGRIVSLKPLNPINAPDAWEREALEQFERGAKEVRESVDIAGAPHLRMMRPFYIEQGCLKCHGDQGYRIGDVRGGIGVTLSLAPFIEAAELTARNLAVGHGAVWLFGIAGIALFTKLSIRRERERQDADAVRNMATAEIEDLYNNAPCGYHSLGPDGTFLRINDTELAWLGYRREELVGVKKFSDVIPPSSLDVFRESYPEFKERGWVKELEFEMLRKDGTLLPVLLSGTAIKDAAGNLLMSRSTVHDISERKRAMDILRRSEARLKEAQRIAHLGHWELDLVGNVLSWSDEVFRLFEVDPRQSGATYEAFLEMIHPDDREMVNRAYTDSVRNRTPYDIVHRLLMKDGRVKYVNERCETYYDPEGLPLRSVGTVHDITERKLAEDAVRDLNQELERRVASRTAQLEAANKELETFAFSVSHDLRAPLRAIDGFSNILLEEHAGKLDEEGRRFLDLVRAQAVRMGQLIDDILSFSRMGRREMEAMQVDMARLARDVAEELQSSAAGRRVRFEIGELPAARGDRAMLRQVLVNLLSNSVKFTQPRAEAVIEVGASAGPEETIYFVKDNGVGFDMQYADKLFGVFQRLHSAQQFDGTGIGLAIVKRIVVRHGGRVWAEGKVDEGATVYFSLPPGDATRATARDFPTG